MISQVKGERWGRAEDIGTEILKYDILFFGEAADGKTIRVGVKGDMDPGYGSTSKMIAESAVTLLLSPEAGAGGVQTPAPAMGALLAGAVWLIVGPQKTTADQGAGTMR